MTIYISSLIFEINILVQSSTIIYICVFELKLNIIHSLLFEPILKHNPMIFKFDRIFSHLLAVYKKFANFSPVKIKKHLFLCRNTHLKLNFKHASVVVSVLGHRNLQIIANVRHLIVSNSRLLLRDWNILHVETGVLECCHCSS